MSLNNLPSPLTTLIDRERELAFGASLLRDRHVRLLTLTGPPGTGKSRLGLALAGAVADNFPDGVWFVPLAPLARSDLVLNTIASVLNLRQIGRRPLLETLRQALRAQRLLLLLDNFEHVLSAAPQIVDLLAGCPETTALVTSRAPLHVSGEHRFSVAPLDVPMLAAEPDLNGLARVPAVRLFVARAQAARSEFALSSANAASVAELCVRLDGLPLAIELAAARSGLLEPWDLLERLGGRLALLADGPRDLPQRHRTLRAAIGWSYDHLSSEEQRVFRRLAVFAGGCTLEAARQVVGTADDKHADDLPSITALLDHNLLRNETPSGGPPRVGMLETVREYALEQLADKEDLEHIQRQHAAFYLDFSKQVANPRLDEPDGPWLMDQIEREHDNLRAALRWLIGRCETESSVRLAGALWSFWDKRGHRTEGLRWLERALALPGTVSPGARAQATMGVAIMHRGRSEYAAAVPYMRDAVAILRDIGDSLSLATALTMLGDLVALAGDPEDGGELAEEALMLREGRPDDMAKSLLACGTIATYRADFRRALDLYSAGLELRRGRSGSEVDALLLFGRGAMLAGADNSAAALPLLEEALAGCRARGEVGGTPRVLVSLGALHARRGECAKARALLEEALTRFRGQGETLGVVLCTLLLGLPLPVGMLAEVGQGAVNMAWRTYLGREAPPPDDLSAWNIVREMPTPQGVTGGLTAREVEVLKLLARRYSNREIAQELMLSVRTVERHIENLFSKTGLSNRRDALAYCQRHQLLPPD